MVLALFLGCKNDIDINAPYKDVAIVYGFLDQNAPVQYIRIQKLYQNASTTSTQEGAQVADSLYFDSLVVNIININKAIPDTFHCYRVDTIPKDSGFFTKDRNTFYATSIPNNNTASEIYVLDIYYPKKKAHFSAKTVLVKNATIEPRKLVLKYNDPKFPNHTFAFKFNSGKNAYLYDLGIRYTYKEMDANDTSSFTIKYVDYNVVRSIAYLPENAYTQSVSSKAFIENLKAAIPMNAAKIRRTLSVTFRTYGGSQEFQTMLDLNKPDLTVVQKNPLYSNIEPTQLGIGIFSSRNYVERLMEIDPSALLLLSKELPNFIY